jgi:hypothetical protein
MKMVGSLASLGKSEADIKKISSAAVYLSNVTGQGLNEAMKQVNATFSGSTDELSKLIPELKGLTKEQLAAGGAADMITQKLGILSDKMSEGVSQKIKNMKETWIELKIEFGKNIAEIFSPMITWIDELGKSWLNNIKNVEAYKRVQESIESGEKTLADQTSGDLAGSIAQMQKERERLIMQLSGGAKTPEIYAQQGGYNSDGIPNISIEQALGAFANMAKVPAVAKLDADIASYTDQLRLILKQRERAGTSTGTPTAPTAPAYAEPFADFIKRMKDSAAQWALYNDLMAKGTSASQIQEEMVKRFAVSSPTSPRTPEDWSRLNANNAAGTTGVPALYTDLLKQIFDNPDIIKAAQDAARANEAFAVAQWDAETKKQTDIAAYTASANDKYLTAMAELFADRTSAEYLFQELETERTNAMAEAQVAGMEDLSNIEAFYAEKKIALEVQVNEMIAENDKKNLEKLLAAEKAAYDKRVKAATDAGLTTMGTGDVGLKTFEGISKLGGDVSSAGAGMSAGAGEGMAGMLQGVLGEVMGGLGASLTAVAGPIGAIVALVSEFPSILGLLNPGMVIIKGIMKVLQPAVEQILQPLMGILMIIGEALGKLLIPILQLITPIIEALALVFMWLYNKLVVPVFNAIIWVFNVIYNAFADFINGILWLIDQIPFVDVGRVGKKDLTAGFLTEINMANISSAGADAAGTGQAGSSASYTQGRTINMTFNENAITVGDGGIRALAVEIRRELINLEQLGA